jgi:hypothetical protein
VVDESGNPAKGIAVSARLTSKLYPLDGTTDAKGSFRITFPRNADDFGFGADVVARTNNRLGIASISAARVLAVTAAARGTGGGDRRRLPLLRPGLAVAD